jgi:hypothetical protein
VRWAASAQGARRASGREWCTRRGVPCVAELLRNQLPSL